VLQYLHLNIWFAVLQPNLHIIRDDDLPERMLTLYLSLRFPLNVEARDWFEVT
jgi:hypothetical protein